MEDIQDIFGLRIICYYLSDIDNIIKKLSDSFIIQTRKKRQDDSQFGYRSEHLIVKLNKEKWNGIITEIENLNFEIQIRTVVMHAWASISHQLFYKKEEKSNKLRELARLSAILEMADIEFNNIKSN